jgi:hypothetical protein
MKENFKYAVLASRNPDKLIRDFRFDVAEPKMQDQKLGANLTLRIELKQMADGSLKYRKLYYFNFKNKLTTMLGNADDMTLAEAMQASEAMAKDKIDTTNPDRLKTPIWQVFDLLSSFNLAWSDRTRAKKEKIFNARFRPIAKKAITELTKADILAICDEIYHEKKYAALIDFYELAAQITRFAYVRDLIKADPIYGLKVSDVYKFPKSDGHATIKSDTDLKLLIRYINNYQGLISVRNALKFGILTALRAGNVRTLTSKNIQTDENGEFYLHFQASEMKIKRDEYIGLPHGVGKWLAKLALDHDNGVIFQSSKGTMLSDAILSKSLRSYVPLDSDVEIVFHSFRKIFSTFSYEKMQQNQLTQYEIERTLSHSVGGVMQVYNKATNVNSTRKALSWWYNYLKNLGLEL